VAERVPLYQLYFLLVHVNLFGGSYVSSVESAPAALI
jgi:fructosamine-3-kinase